MDEPIRGCPLEAALQVIGGKWKTVLLHHLMEKTMRFGELKKSTTGITQRTLTRQLRELESDGLIAREVFREVPPKVEYSMTPRGRTLRPIIEALAAWGKEHALPAAPIASDADREVDSSSRQD